MFIFLFDVLLHKRMRVKHKTLTYLIYIIVTHAHAGSSLASSRACLPWCCHCSGHRVAAPLSA